MANFVQRKGLQAFLQHQSKLSHNPIIARKASTLADSFYNEEQKELQNTVKKLIDAEINPHADKWEKEKMFPAHEVFKKFGDQGLLGINKPTEYGGLGLSYKYEMAF